MYICVAADLAKESYTILDTSDGVVEVVSRMDLEKLYRKDINFRIENILVCDNDILPAVDYMVMAGAGQYKVTYEKLEGKNFWGTVGRMRDNNKLVEYRLFVKGTLAAKFSYNPIYESFFQLYHIASHKSKPLVTILLKNMRTGDITVDLFYAGKLVAQIKDFDFDWNSINISSNAPARFNFGRHIVTLS